MSAVCVGSPLADAEDHEFSGSRRSDANETDQASVVEVVLCHRRPVAPNEERLLRLVAEQRASTPFIEQEILNRAPDVGPQAIVVRLKDCPLGPFLNRVLEIDQEPSHVDVLPFGIGTYRACAPHHDTATEEVADDIDPFAIE